MNVTELRLAWWQLRGQRSRAWLFIACVAIGVTAIVSVGSLMGQVSRAVNREARSLIAADLEVSGTKPMEASKLADLSREAGPQAHLQQRAGFLSVLSAAGSEGKRSRLCMVSAVEDGYPFYGKLKARLQDGSEINHGLSFLNAAEPQALVAPELLPQLGIQVGDTLKAGRLTLRVAGVLLEEPGIGSGAFSLGPRVLIGISHLQATGLAGFGARVNYATLVALPAPELAAGLSAKIKALWHLNGDADLPGPPPTDSVRVRTYEDAEANLKRSFGRLTDFLSLASLMALILGGIGIASVVRGFVREQYPSIGVLRSLGASGKSITRLYLWQCLGLGLVGSLLGALAGTLLQNLLPGLLKDFLPVSLGFGVDAGACLLGLGLGLFTSGFFSLLPILELQGSHPAELFRDELGARSSRWIFWILAVLGALFFLGAGSAVAHSLKRGGAFIGALAAGALFIWGFSWLGLKFVSRLRLGGVGLRHGLSNLARPGLRPTASVIALGCAILHLGILAIYQGSLLSELDPGKRPDEIPGLFLIDIQSDQVAPLRSFIEGQGLKNLSFSPMVKARYRGKNGEELKASKGVLREDEDDKNMKSREQNLSYRRELSQGEQIIAGKWMNPDGDEVEASLEEWFAQRLGVKVGDRLSFDVQGVQVEAKVTSLRKVHWASFQPNFFILLSPWALQSAPQVWIGSVAGLKDGQRERLQTDLVEKFPNVTVFDVAEGSKKIMGIMTKISWAIRVVALFSLFAGLVVLAGIALSTARSRQQEAALLKTLGAGRGTILASLGAEFGALGLLSGLFGLGLSVLFGWVLLE